MSELIINNITPFKDRSIEFGKPVMVYRNLTRKGKVYSIKQGGRVVAFADKLALMNVSFKISYKAQAKVRETKHRQVHAYAKGYIIPSINTSELINNEGLNQYYVTYNPYNNNNFVKYDVMGDQYDIFESKFVTFSDKGLNAYK